MSRFRLWDTQPPTAQLTRRDANLFNDDAVILVLDTYNDQRSAYYFMTNALATQTDGRITDDGRTVDATWDAPWQCAAQQTDFGWSVEMAIPVTWGVNFGRSRRRNLETSFWAGPLDNKFRVSQAGALTGLSIPKPVHRQQIIPYGLSTQQQHRSDKLTPKLSLEYELQRLTLDPDPESESTWFTC